AAGVEAKRNYVSRWESGNHSPGFPAAKKARDDLEKAEANLESVRDRLREPVRERLLRAIELGTTQPRYELEKEIELLTGYNAQLEKSVSDQEAENKQAGGWSYELQLLHKGIAADEQILKIFEDEVHRLTIELDKWQPRITKFREAVASQARDSSKKTKMSALAGLGLFGAVIAAIVLLELRTRRISTLEEVESKLNLRVMGTLPHMPTAVTKAGSRNSGRRAFWHSVLTESVDSTRTVLLRDAAVESMQAIMVTSATTGEGKTTLTCHLATSLARAGRKVLLIDCDLRRPSIHKVFELPATVGVCELLRGQGTFEEAVHQTSKEGLFVLPAGRLDAAVLGALAQGRFGEILGPAKEQFELVILDSAPVLPVTDSLLVAQHCDGVIFTVRRHVSRALKVAAACQRMAMLGIPMLGVVAIGLDDGVSGYSYSYRYGSGYGYGYGYGYGSRYLRSDLQTAGAPGGAGPNGSNGSNGNGANGSRGNSSGHT
ncbi:MAG TPA: polysaccharide biosynthesis tyrosine autokinase, partial [Planctomycetaceae bacterium]|nr:polysaccharide biosynthesis tyrosine autokinase [Planctomycetaceae bacterium]